MFRQFSLSFSQSLLVSFEKARIVYSFLCRKSSKTFKPNIYTNSLLSLRQWFRFIFNRKTSIPLIILPSDSAGFESSNNRPMKFDFNRPYFRKFKAIILNTPPKASLFISETIITVKAFKSWIASLAIFSLNSTEKP